MIPPANNLFGPLAMGLRRLLPGGPLAGPFNPAGPPRSRGLRGPRYATARIPLIVSPRHTYKIAVVWDILAKISRGSKCPMTPRVFTCVDQKTLVYRELTCKGSTRESDSGAHSYNLHKRKRIYCRNKIFRLKPVN